MARLNDPAVRNRCVKLKFRSELQNGFAGLAFLLFLLTCSLLKWGYIGTSSHGYGSTIPALIAGGFTTLGISLILLIGLIGFRNYCLLDPLEHRIYHHFRFLWWQKTELIFRQGEILGVTTEGQRRTINGAVLWYYRLVAIGANGRQQPLSNWREGGLDKWNTKAAELALQLDCKAFAAPPQSALSIEENGGAFTLKFGPPERPPLPKIGRVAFLLLIIALPLALLLYYFIVVRATH